ncbi:MAG: alpha/beta fold hydrolase [Candidatus Heimdallarchaeota archaeon]
MPEWERKKITLENNITYDILQFNKTKETTIIYIHGLGSSKEDFQDAIEYPELQNYNLLSVDLLGHGDSDKPKNFAYTMAEQAIKLKELIIQLNLDKNIILIAHSMGGPIAILLAELFKEKIKAIVYAEGNIDLGDCFFSNSIIAENSFEEWKNESFQKTVEMLKSLGIDMQNYTMLFEKAGPETIYFSSHDLLQISKKDTLIQNLVDLKTPILPIFGEKNKDKFSSEEKLAKYFQIMYVANSGHSMMIDNPDEFYRIIVEFLSKI